MPERTPPDAITPDSRVGELLTRWPALEEVLVELSPHFRALQNPVLRRTVAKVATLRQVAVVGGVPLGVLIERLRAAVGIAHGCAPTEHGAAPAARPTWATGAARARDARPDVEAGRHPLPEIMADLAALGDGEVYALVTPFAPAPLMDLAREKGFECFSAAEEEDKVRTWFRRRPASGEPTGGR